MADDQKQSKEDVNLRKRLEVIFGLRDKIDQALHKVYKKGDFTQKQISDYLDNPGNFQTTEWAFIQQQRDKVFNFIWDTLGPEEKKKHEKTQLQKKSKKRKRKSIGHRRKWIQMD